MAPLLWAHAALTGVVAIAVATTPVIVLVEVAARNVFAVSATWYQDAIALCVYVVTFMGGALAYDRGQHLRLSAHIQRLPKGAQMVVDGAAEWIVLCTAVCIAASSLRLLQVDWIQTMPVLQISETWAVLPLPLGLLIVACIALARIWQLPRRVGVLSGAPVVGVAAAIVLVTHLFPAVWRMFGVSGPMAAVLGTSALCLGVPVAFVFAGAALIYFYLSGTAPLVAAPLAMHSGVGNFVLIALPCFFLLAYLMDEAQLAARLASVVSALLGVVRHSAMYAIIATMYVFSGLSGSKSADIAAVGRALLAICDERGYRRADSAAVLAASAAMGETIPPSIALLVLGSITTLSVGALFLGGLLPAAVMAAALALVVSLRPAPAGKPSVITDRTPLAWWRGVAGVLPIVAGIAFLVGSIVTGMSTPTEASALVVLFMVVLATAAYRSLNWRAATRALVTTSSLCGAILLVVAAASAVSNAVGFSGVLNTVGAIDFGPDWLFFLVSMVVLLVAGAVLEGLPALLLFVPILMPMAAKLGINPLQYGIAAIIAMGIGAHTPPVGIGLYTACVVGDTSVEAVGKAILPYLLVLCAGLLAVLLAPQLSLFLPTVAGLRVR
ncbi:MAG TPA: TRAP transporter large permease subunit [bacterium]|nr:TRAP transporter large permease subunit [bacterium]